MLTWFLICQYNDDTMAVVTHWHHAPTTDEINQMIEAYPPSEQSCIFYTVRDTTPRRVHSRIAPCSSTDSSASSSA